MSHVHVHVHVHHPQTHNLGRSPEGTRRDANARDCCTDLCQHGKTARCPIRSVRGSPLPVAAPRSTSHRAEAGGWRLEAGGSALCALQHRPSASSLLQHRPSASSLLQRGMRLCHLDRWRSRRGRLGRLALEHLRGDVHAACACACSMCMCMQHVHVHAACGECSSSLQGGVAAACKGV